MKNKLISLFVILIIFVISGGLICAEDYPVEFEDKSLERAVRETIDKDEGDLFVCK